VKLKLTIIALMLTTLTAGALTPQEMVMGAAYRVRGAAPVAEIGNAVDLDGSTEWLNNTNNTAYSTRGTNTLMAWVKTSSTNGNQRILTIESNDGSGGYAQFFIRLVSGAPSVFARGDLSATAIFTDSAKIADGNWHHVAGVINGTLGRAILYVDGSVRGTNMASIFAVNTMQVLQIGAVFDSAVPPTGGQYFNGVIDEVSVHRVALSPSDIAEAYNSGTGKRINTLSAGTNNLSNLVHLDETGTASTAYDSVTGVSMTGTNIGSGDWVAGKVPK
jgi:hypothetical protein